MRRTFGILMLLGSLALICGGVFAGPAPATTMTLAQARGLFSSGNAAYRAEKFDQAFQAYEQLAENGYDSAPVLYNLGTTAARLGKKGAATGYLMKARSRDPHDDNIRANLARVTASAEKEPKAEGITAETVWSRFLHLLSLQEWLAVAWLALVLVCLAASLRLLVSGVIPRRIAAGGMAVGAVILAAVIIPTVTLVYRSTVHKSIAVEDGSVHSGPAERYTVLTTLAEGDVVHNLNSETDGFSRVQLENGIQGYVPAGKLIELQ